MRIVIDVRHLRDFGIGTYIRNLLLALGTIDSATKYILTALPDDIDEFSSLPPNFEVVSYPHRDNKRIDHISYPWFVRNFAPDLVHMPLASVPLGMRKPYVVTIHDMSSLLFEMDSGWRDNLRLYKFRRGLVRADCVIAVSEATRRDVESVLRVPSDRVRLVYSAPDPQFLAPDSPQMHFDRKRMLERYQINYPFLLYAGRIRTHKNIPRLIEAFAVVRGELENHPIYHDLRLIIIGDQITQHSEVRRTVVQTRMQQAVRFLGFLPFETLKMFYASAAAFVFPSLYEGFGLPPLEAMATGTPVITTNVSSLPEVVGDAAMFVNPENVFDIARGIREVLTDVSLRSSLIQKGSRQVLRFNWDSTAREVLGVYNEVVARKN